MVVSFEFRRYGVEISSVFIGNSAIIEKLKYRIQEEITVLDRVMQNLLFRIENCKFLLLSMAYPLRILAIIMAIFTLFTDPLNSWIVVTPNHRRRFLSQDIRLLTGPHFPSTFPSRISWSSTLGMMSDGMQFAWVSPAVPKLLSNESTIHMTKKESEWVAQSYLVGCIVGAAFSFLIFKEISRKWSVFISAIPIAVSWLGILLSWSPITIFVSRFVGGIGRNMVFVAVPMYIGEIASPEIRGILGTFIYIMTNFGGLVVYSVTPYTAFSIPCFIGLSLAILQLCLLYFVPESPYYWVKKGNKNLARESLQLLRRRNDVEEELKALDSALQKQSESTSFTDIFTKSPNLKAVCILFFLRISQMFSGVSVMTMNIHTIFNDIGGNISTNASAIIYSVMMLTSAMCTMGIMDRFGRKPLMIFSSLIASLALLTEGTYFYLKYINPASTEMIYWLPIVSTIVFVYGYRVGLGTVPIVMIGELLNVNVKVPGIVMSDIIYTIASFTANQIFYITSSNFGMFAPFYIFGAVCICTAFFSKIFVPETKGKTLEEIQSILMVVRNNKDDNKDTKECK